MLSITYFAFLKRKIAERKLPLIWVIVVTAIIFIIPQVSYTELRGVTLSYTELRGVTRSYAELR